MTRVQQVSVVIPTYNRAEMLRAALESVLAQTVPVLEVVVVDDGSTDDTPYVVEELQGKGAPLMYLRGEHTNCRGDVRNRGVEACRGEIIAFLDSDDLWKPDRIQRQLNSFNEADEVSYAFCNVHRFDESGLIGAEPCLVPSANYNGNILGDLLLEPLAVSSTLMVRREAFLAVGGFADLRMNEDYELTLRLATRYRAGYVSDVLVLMREHSGRTSRSNRETPLLDYISIVESFLAQHPDLPAQIRAQGKRGLANVHLKLARFYIEQDERAEARKHVLALMRLRPWDRRALSTYLRSWSPA